MDQNEYALAALVDTKLGELRAEAARRALVPRRRLRVRARLGTVLIAVGRRLLDTEGAAPPRVEPSHA